MKNTIFKGVGTALITPFCDGVVDYASLEILIKRQLKAKVDALIVLGTTGEPCTIDDKDREKIIKLAVGLCKGKSKVIVGCGSNSTQKAITYYKQAQSLGANGALIVTPYYNKCTQDGLIKHYCEIAQNGSLPIIVYNVPSRTGVNILPKTYAGLIKIKNICAIKEASGNVLQVLEIFKNLGEKVDVYSGEDALNYIFYALGGSGCISVLSNVAPNLCKKIYSLASDGNFKDALNMQLDLLPLANALFLEVNPTPVKSALNYLGLCKNELKLPLVPMTQNNFKVLKQEIDRLWAKYDCL